MVSLVILILGFNYLRGIELFRSSDTYYAIYDNIDGLEASNPVVLNGYKIGRVNKIRMDQESKKITVTFSVNDDLMIPLDSRARIINKDLLGAKALELILGEQQVYYEKYDTMPSEVALSIAATIDNIVSPITNKANRILGELQEYLRTGGKEDIQTTVRNLAETSQNLANTTNELDEFMITERLRNIFDKIEGIATNLENNSENINLIMANLGSFSDSLKASNIKQTIQESHAMIVQVNSITEKINKGEGSLGLLVNDDELYTNLTKASENLNSLVADLEENPGDYVHFSVFGRKDKDKKEKD